MELLWLTQGLKAQSPGLVASSFVGFHEAQFDDHCSRQSLKTLQALVVSVIGTVPNLCTQCKCLLNE